MSAGRRTWVAGVVVVAALGAQAFRPPLNRSDAAPNPHDFIQQFSPPAEVRSVLKTACYDCHSDTTHYPWYAHVQPLGWWLARHIEDAKHEVNFSRFGAYSPKQQARVLERISSSVADHSMPLESYVWIHRDAKLTDAQADAVSAWMDALYDRIAPE